MEIPLFEPTTVFLKNFIIIISLSLLRICNNHRNPAGLRIRRLIGRLRSYRNVDIAIIDAGRIIQIASRYRRRLVIASSASGATA